MTFDNNGHALKRLHARLVDIHRGFEGGMSGTTDPAVADFFGRFRSMHDRHRADLDRLMRGRGLRPRSDGSWATLSHAGMMAYRTAPERLDASAIDPAMRGERILLDLYDDALEAVRGDGDARAVLLAHKADILSCVVGGDALPRAA